ncbi:MAG TPA: hypothetical protein VFJ82_05925 [Longimicrobium sp.]|nr:hypothetical protein [Longimicrobium sp.]
MSNLTFDQNLIRKHTPEPLEGHNVVVLERSGEAGEKFHSVLEPGGDPLRPGILAMMLGRPNVYFAFAVDASRDRPLEFDERVHMAERAHEFHLYFTLWYRVGDPKLLVATRDQDPLERVRKKVAEVVTEEIAELSWAEVWHSFRPASERVVRSTLVELKSYARDFGITITSLKLKAGFDPGVADTDRDIHAARERGRLLGERMAVADELKSRRAELRRDGAVRDREARADAARGRIEDIIVGKYEDFLRDAHNVDDVGYVYRSLAAGPGGDILAGAPSNGAHLPSNGHTAPVLPAGVAAVAGDHLPGVLNELITLTQTIDTQIQRHQVRAAVLHVVAAVLADDSPQPTPAQTGFARQAQTAIASATHLPPDRLEKLGELADPKGLRARLHGS